MPVVSAVLSGRVSNHALARCAEDSARYRPQPMFGKRSACPTTDAILSRSMSEHKITLTWKRGDTPFEYQKYSRDHTWKFDGGHEMQASAAPAYLGNPKLVDPEEAFVASLSSCQMLTFLAIAAKKKFILDEYVDEAIGYMEKNAEGKLAITRVTLKPRLKFSGEKQPTEQDIEEMNHAAHEQCFIANSVKTEVTVETQT
jgi:organic hydroperoxide reductase OsmC/OhrA